MAIAYDNSTYQDIATSTGTVTFSHTCTGSNLLLLVGVHDNDGDGVSGVTYNGTSMTKVGSSVNLGGNHYLSLYYLLGPSTGANDIIVTVILGHHIYAGVSSFTGVKQSGFPDASNTGTLGAGNTALTVAITTVADNCWVFMTASGVASGGGSSSGTNWTERNGYSRALVGDTNGVKTPAGSISLTANWGSSQNVGLAGIAVSFAPFVPVSFITQISIS